MRRHACVGATPNSVATASKDVVRLKDGSVVRGTISELLKNRSVTIVTLSGKTLEFAMSDVAYAGPESKAGGCLVPRSASAA